jgi:hypothetical protein
MADKMFRTLRTKDRNFMRQVKNVTRFRTFLKLKGFLIRGTIMKRIISLNLLKFSVIIILVSFSKAETLNNNTSEEFYPVDPNRIPEIVTMISNRTKSNYEQIKTWQGKLEVVTDYIYERDRAKKVFTEDTKASGEAPKELLEHRETIIEFSLDAEKGFSHENYYPIKPIEQKEYSVVADLSLRLNIRLIVRDIRNTVMLL